MRLHNTLTRQIEDFNPEKTDRVKLYSCGPTVYNYAHIGNLRAYIFVDSLKKTLTRLGFKVLHVMNITDVGHLTSNADEGEDKIIASAQNQHKTVWEIADFYTKAFFDDLRLLNIQPAQIISKATDHIAEMIDFVSDLEKKGFTYIASGNVYFDTSKFKDYGKLRGSQHSGEKIARVEQDPAKRHQDDFVLWFTNYKYSHHEMLWNSPWGKGFPGWHIECSAMASKYLGEYIDIHTGGVDHIPIHHTNEIAQSEARFGHEWVKYWLHNEFLTIKDSGKMSKSSREFLILSKLIEHGFEPLAYRYLVLNSHYRKALTFTFESLTAAQNALRRAKEKIKRLADTAGNYSEFQADAEYISNFNSGLADDLNTPKALGLFWTLLEDQAIDDPVKLKTIESFDQVLSLNLLSQNDQDLTIPDEIKELVEKRNKLRNEKKWQEADQIRKQVEQKGFEIEDIPSGYKITRIR